MLNGRSFGNLAQLNDVTAWWLAQVADVRCIARPSSGPSTVTPWSTAPDRVAGPALRTAQVFDRIADVEGYVCYQQNYYSVPWGIGQALPFVFSEAEVIIYSPAVVEIAGIACSRGAGQQPAWTDPSAPETRRNT